MARYAIDSDVLGTIQRSGYSAEIGALGRLPVVITDAVWDELTINAAANGSNAASVRAAEDLLKAIAGGPTVLEPATPEAVTLDALHGDVATEDLGEHSIMAYTVHNPDVMAVLIDKRATCRAVEEVRGRVLSLHGFLDVLRAEHRLDRRVASAISQYFCVRHKPTVPPLWW
ncbi:MAG: hypothetical protein HY901_02690 [Deltaproteobacteria bacterium]|nr:hypothetical protein [Deltaproteobacteria bacterium]